jgi:hypothetical protein
MKRFIFLILLFVSILVYSEKSSEAIGVGIYAEGGGGGSYFWYIDPRHIDQNYNNNMGFVGGGVVFDTALSTDSMFNYRAELGYAWKRNLKFKAPDYKFDDRSIVSYDFDLNEIKLVNSFGFALYSNKSIRFWLGPQLNFLVLWGVKKDTFTTAGSPGVTSVKGAEYNLTSGGIGLGLVLGLNINFKGFVTLSIEAGFRANFAAGTLYSGGEYYNNAVDLGYYWAKPLALVLTPEGFATVGVIFRFLEK